MQLWLNWEEDPTKHTYIQCLTRRALILFACLMYISLESSISSMERVTPNNILHISLKHAVMLDLKEIGWWSNSSDPLKVLFSTSKLPWRLNLLITGNKWSMSSSTDSTALNALLVWQNSQIWSSWRMNLSLITLIVRNLLALSARSFVWSFYYWDVCPRYVVGLVVYSTNEEAKDLPKASYQSA